MGRFAKLTLVSFLVAMLVIVSFGSGFGFGRYSPPAIKGIPAALADNQPPDTRDEFGVFWEAWQILKNEFVDKDKLTDKQLTEGAIRGLVASTGDPNMSYRSPDDVKEDQRALQGGFDGIGATVNQDDQKRLIIIQPMEGSPAQQAGLKPGDWIQAADGEDTTKMSVNEAVTKIRGPRGTKVTLTILRQGESKPFDVVVTRGPIKESTVFSRITPEGYAYIQITSFSLHTAEELRTQITELNKSNPKGIILDLRNNLGGELQNCIQVVSQFLSDGIVLDSVDSDGKRQTYNVIPGGMMTTGKMAVLVNKFSASASEVTSGALQDNGRATIIGEQTFGKGTVNVSQPLSNGGAVYVSIARWHTPKGRLIEKTGITPDIPVTLSDDDIKNHNDAQYQRAIEFLNTGK